MKPARLITIVRGDLSAGLQIAQTAHAVAEFCLYQKHIAWDWHDDGNYLICLQVKDVSALNQMRERLIELDVVQHMFYEPDVESNTALAFVETEQTKTLTKGLPLAGMPVK